VYWRCDIKSKYPVEPFDRSADRYDQKVASVPLQAGFPHAGYEEVLDQVVQRTDTRPGIRILDLGVGTGNLAVRFVSIGCKIWGIDFSSNMLDKARQKLRNAVLVQADLLGDWPDEIQQRFDRVVSTYALHHFDLNTKCGLLSRVSRRFLVSGGLIVVGDLSFPTAQAREEARSEAWEDEEFCWAGDEAIEAFTEIGLQTEYKQISSCGGIYVMEQA